MEEGMAPSSWFCQAKRTVREESMPSSGGMRPATTRAEREGRAVQRPAGRGRGNIVLFPFLAQGHMNPYLDLARLLAARYPELTLILVTTTGNLPHLRRLFPTHHLAELPFHPVDHDLPSDTDTSFALLAYLIIPFHHATQSLEPSFLRLLSDLSTALD